MAKTIVADEAGIQQGADLIRAGGIVAFPTETVYGLGANAFDAAAVARIFEAKRRPSFDPLIVHLATPDDVGLVGVADGPVVERLMSRFWPGPMTLVLPRVDQIPGIVTAGLSTVAVRVPLHTIATRLILTSGCPIAAPSANRFGSLSPTRASHVEAGLGEQVDLILDGGATTWGVESTIVAVVDGKVSVLRLGAVTLEDLSDVANTTLVAPTPSSRVD